MMDDKIETAAEHAEDEVMRRCGAATTLPGHAATAEQEPLPEAVARKPVVQYVVEELHRCGIRRLLFVTGPGKTAIENHFDVDDELIATLDGVVVATAERQQRLDALHAGMAKLADPRRIPDRSLPSAERRI